MKFIDRCLDHHQIRRQYDYVPFEDGIAIVRYRGYGPNAWIPSTIDGRQVVGIFKTTFEGRNCDSSGRYEPMGDVRVPDGVRYLEPGLFDGCPHLRCLRLDNGIKEIQPYMLSSHSELRRTNIPKSVISIGERAFSGCTDRILDQSCHNEYLPDRYSDIGLNVTSIGAGAFKDCSRLGNSQDCRFPNTLTSIGADAFKGCSSLCAVELRNSTMGDIDVRENAFENCGLKWIRMSESVTNIGDYAFAGCKDLESVHFERDAPTFGRLVFAGCDKAIVYYESGSKGWDSTVAGRPAEEGQ